MGLTIFHKLVLHTLAIAAWHHGEADLARLMRQIALGHHTESQKEALLNQWVSRDKREW